MTSDHQNSATHSAESEDKSTGVPGLRTWRSVYLVVGVIFVLWIVLLTILTETFS